MIKKINDKILKLNRSALVGISRVIVFLMISLSISISSMMIANSIFNRFIFDSRPKVVFFGSDEIFSYLEFNIKSKYQDEIRFFKGDSLNYKNEKFHIIISENLAEINYFKNTSKIVNIAPIINKTNAMLTKKEDIMHYLNFDFFKNKLFIAFSTKNKDLEEILMKTNKIFQILKSN